MSDPICVIGDSITAGVVFSGEKQRYVHHPDSFINLLGSALGCEIRNHSKFGFTVPMARERMERFTKDISECGHTIVMLGGNDSDFDWPAVAETPESEHDCKTSLREFVDSYGCVLDRILNLGSNPVLLSLMPVDGRAYYKWFSKTADPEALMRFLHYTETIEHWNEMYNLAVMKLAARRGLPLIDVRSALLQKKFFDGLLSEDGIHPSPEGHRVIFDYILPQAKSILI